MDPSANRAGNSAAKVIAGAEVTASDSSHDNQPASTCQLTANRADWAMLDTTSCQLTEEEDDDDTCSEQAGQCERKRCLDRFSFVTKAEVRPISGSEYEVLGDAGLPFLHAKIRHPSTGCCSSSDRSIDFLVDISDISSRQTVVKLICDRHGFVIVESPPSEIIGYVNVERILCSLRFLIRDIHGTARLLVRTPKYCAVSCNSHSYKILLPDESDEVATIQRRVIQAVEAAAKGPTYTLQVAEMMSTDMKAILIGVMMLFDRKLFP